MSTKSTKIEQFEALLGTLENAETKSDAGASNENEVLHEFVKGELVSESHPKVRVIPMTRPVMSEDLENLRTDLGFTVHEICSLLRIHTPSRWYALTGEKSKEPVDAAIAKAAIWYSRHPDRAPLFEFNMNELYEHPRLRRNIEWLGSLFGRTKIAANKWLRGAKQEPYVLAMVVELKRLLDEADAAESRCRGGDNSRSAHLLRAKTLTSLNEFIDMAQEYQRRHGKDIAKARRHSSKSASEVSEPIDDNDVDDDDEENA